MMRRNKIALLVLLLIGVLYVAYRDFQTPEIAPTVSRADEKFVPIQVQNPALRLDLLDKMKSVEYQGSHRNIFSASLPAPPPPPPKPVVQAPPPPPVPQGPPPLVVPAKFFGYVTESRTGTRRAFFSAGDDVYVLSVGEVLLGRFRLIRINDASVELEEISSGRRTTQIMEVQQ